MTDPLRPDPEQPFVAEDRPFAGFEVTVVSDRAVYAVGETVRLTVSAVNGAADRVEHHYPGWQRFVLTIRDSYHRVVATDAAEIPDDGGFTDRWLPGSAALFPRYWSQSEGPIVPAWSDQPPGPRVEAGRYRARVTWLGRHGTAPAPLEDVWTPWFDLV